MNRPLREKKRQQENMLSAWRSELEFFRRQLKLDEKSDATVQKCLRDVRAFLKWQGGTEHIGKEQAIAYKDWLSRHSSIRSANSMLTALNQFLKYIGAENCCLKLFRVQFQTLCDQERGVARDEYEKERDISHLADSLGHKSVNTTRIYTLGNGKIYRSQIKSLELLSQKQRRWNWKKLNNIMVYYVIKTKRKSQKNLKKQQY